MLAALWIADENLFERLIAATFPLHPDDSDTGAKNSPADGKADPRSNALLVGQAVKEKIVAAVRACKDMLLHEPPERMTDFWGTVSAQNPLASLYARQQTDKNGRTHIQPESMNLIKPIMKKLRKCRDPDRFDLIALHKKRLEFREKETGPTGKNSTVEDDGTVFGGGGTAAAKTTDRESKRRKVALQDPFGPAL